MSIRPNTYLSYMYTLLIPYVQSLTNSRDTGWTAFKIQPRSLVLYALIQVSILQRLFSAWFITEEQIGVRLMGKDILLGKDT